MQDFIISSMMTSLPEIVKNLVLQGLGGALALVSSRADLRLGLCRWLAGIPDPKPYVKYEHM